MTDATTGEVLRQANYSYGVDGAGQKRAQYAVQDAASGGKLEEGETDLVWDVDPLTGQSVIMVGSVDRVVRDAHTGEVLQHVRENVGPGGVVERAITDGQGGAVGYKREYKDPESGVLFVDSGSGGPPKSGDTATTAAAAPTGGMPFSIDRAAHFFRIFRARHPRRPGRSAAKYMVDETAGVAA